MTFDLCDIFNQLKHKFFKKKKKSLDFENKNKKRFFTCMYTKLFTYRTNIQLYIIFQKTENR